jgi:hypothetical protein
MGTNPPKRVRHIFQRRSKISILMEYRLCRNSYFNPNCNAVFDSRNPQTLQLMGWQSIHGRFFVFFPLRWVFHQGSSPVLGRLQVVRGFSLVVGRSYENTVSFLSPFERQFGQDRVLLSRSRKEDSL